MMSTNQFAQDTAIALVKASPAIGVAATGATGAVDWSTVAYMLTAFYMVLQILLLIPKYRQMLREWETKV
ncbi:putative membrane protein [Pseudomonas syringae group genomosp. 3]|nr:putative membrane protein [Pseudomonas syringae group genomosp. 3]